MASRLKVVLLALALLLVLSQTVFAQSGRSGDDAAGAAGAMGGLCFMLFYFGMIIAIFAGLWQTFAKAGEPGWAAIIPIYNGMVLCRIAGKPEWWVILLFIPCVGIIFSILILIDLAKNFGKGGGFIAGLILLPFIFYPILGFDSSTYRKVTV